MKKYRVAFNGLAGFNTKDFDDRTEAFAWVATQTRLKLIAPLRLMKYNEQTDTYETIGNFRLRNGGAK